MTTTDTADGVDRRVQWDGTLLINRTAAVLVGPVLANHGAVLGFYLGFRLTHSPEIAAVAGGASGLLAGAVGLFFGLRYLNENTNQ